MSKESSAVSEKEAASAASQYVLVFEIEGAAVDGRARLFDAVRNAFAKAGAEISEIQFARHCTHGAVPSIIEKLIADCGDGKVGADAAEAIFNEFVSSCTNNGVSHPVFAAVIDEAASRGMQLHAITILPEDAAAATLAAAGLDRHSIEIHAFPPEERHFPRVDCWMKVSRQVGRQPRGCIAVIGSRDSGKSALSSGMRSVVVPDRFTAYQDFGGTDAVLENTEDYPVKELFDALT